MDKSTTHVIVPYFNIKRFLSYKLNLNNFIDHMKSFGVNLWIAETAFGEHDFEYNRIPGVNHVGFRTKSPIWVKERSINLTVQRLPEDWRYLIVLDGDIMFRNQGWLGGTLDALQHYDWVYPYEYCYDLGPHGDHMELHYSFGRQWIKEPITCSKMGAGYTFAHPGYGFATRRDTLEKLGGLIDTAIAGAADHHAALSLIGKAELSFPGGISEGYKKPILEWQERATRHVSGNIGYVPGTIEHSFHSEKRFRAYISRWDILTNNNFDPQTNLKVNTTGMYELCGDSMQLKRDMMKYFTDRADDNTVLTAAQKIFQK